MQGDVSEGHGAFWKDRRNGPAHHQLNELATVYRVGLALRRSSCSCDALRALCGIQIRSVPVGRETSQSLSSVIHYKIK